MTDASEAADALEKQCAELAEKLTNMLFGYPKHVAVCVMPAVMAAVAKTLGMPRETVIAMFDSAMEDMQE
jgi:hypothetical protein